MRLSPLFCSFSSTPLFDKKWTKEKTSLIIETERPENYTILRFSYGAEAINPYLVFDTISSLFMKKFQILNKTSLMPQARLFKRLCLKWEFYTKSYCGAQIFDAIGISEDINEFFWYIVSHWWIKSR